MVYVKRVLLLFTLLFVMIKGERNKYVVSILPFYGANIQNSILTAGTNKLETSLLESKRFLVIEKGRRDAILREQKEQLSGCFSDSCVVKIGKLIGADYLFIGQIINLEKLFQINIKIVGISKGNVLAKVTKEITGSTIDLLLGIENASHYLIKKLDRKYRPPKKTDLSLLVGKPKINYSAFQNMDYQYRKTTIGLSSFLGYPGYINWGVRISHYPFSVEYSQGIEGSKTYHVNRVKDLIANEKLTFIDNVTENYITGRELSIGIGLWQFNRSGVSLNAIVGQSEYIGEQDYPDYYEIRNNIFEYYGWIIKFYRSFWFAGIGFIDGDKEIKKESELVIIQAGLQYSIGFGKVD